MIYYAKAYRPDPSGSEGNSYFLFSAENRELDNETNKRGKFVSSLLGRRRVITDSLVFLRQSIILAPSDLEVRMF